MKHVLTFVLIASLGACASQSRGPSSTAGAKPKQSGGDVGHGGGEALDEIAKRAEKLAGGSSESAKNEARAKDLHGLVVETFQRVETTCRTGKIPGQEDEQTRWEGQEVNAIITGASDIIRYLEEIAELLPGTSTQEWSMRFSRDLGALMRADETQVSASPRAYPYQKLRLCKLF